MDEPTDAQLFERLNRGDAAAFGVLYARYGEWTRRISRRFADSDADAAEITQDVFMRWLRQFPGLQMRAKATTYLYSAVRNVAFDRRRKDRRLHFTGEITEPHSPVVVLPDPAVADEESMSLRQSLEKLPDGFREVLLMRIVDGMSVSDVGVALGVAEGTVKSRLARAIEMLRKHMDDRSGDDLDSQKS